MASPATGFAVVVFASIAAVVGLIAKNMNSKRFVLKRRLKKNCEILENSLSELTSCMVNHRAHLDEAIRNIISIKADVSSKNIELQHHVSNLEEFVTEMRNHEFNLSNAEEHKLETAVRLSTLKTRINFG